MPDLDGNPQRKVASQLCYAGVAHANAACAHVFAEARRVVVAVYPDHRLAPLKLRECIREARQPVSEGPVRRTGIRRLVEFLDVVRAAWSGRVRRAYPDRLSKNDLRSLEGRQTVVVQLDDNAVLVPEDRHISCADPSRAAVRPYREEDVEVTVSSFRN